MVCFRFYY